MKKIYLSVVCLLISIPLIAQLYVEPEKEVECSVFLAKEGRGRAQQGLEIWDDYIFSCEDGGHVNIYDFKVPIRNLWQALSWRPPIRTTM